MPLTGIGYNIGQAVFCDDDIGHDIIKKFENSRRVTNGGILSIYK